MELRLEVTRIRTAIEAVVEKEDHHGEEAVEEN